MWETVHLDSLCDVEESRVPRGQKPVPQDIFQQSWREHASSIFCVSKCVRQENLEWWMMLNPHHQYVDTSDQSAPGTDFKDEPTSRLLTTDEATNQQESTGKQQGQDRMIVGSERSHFMTSSYVCGARGGALHDLCMCMRI